MVTKNYLKKSKGQKDVSLISKFCDHSEVLNKIIIEIDSPF